MKENKLIELIIFIREQGKLDVLNTHIQLETKRTQKKIVKKLDWELWAYLHKYLNYPKDNRVISMDRIDRVIFGKSTVQRRRDAFFNLTQVIRQFLILEELKEDDLLNDWLYWKAIKSIDSKELRKQDKSIAKALSASNLSKSPALHQFIAYDFYKNQYSKDCLENALPDNTNLINAYCALELLFEQNNAVFQAEFENRSKILNEHVDTSMLKYPKDIAYQQLIASIPLIPNDIGAAEFIAPYIDFLNDEAVDLIKKNDLIQFLLNKAYITYIEGNNQPIKYFWDIYFNFCNDNRVFYNGQYFSMRHYCNILALLSRFDKSRVADFIDKYESLLSEKDKPVAEQFGRVFQAYNNKEYEKIITTLSTQEVSYGRHFDLKIRYNVFKVKAHFEVYLTNQDEAVKKRLNGALKNFSAFLSSKVKLNELRLRNENFIEWVKKLLKDTTKEELLQYKQDVKKDTVHIKWLIEKINQKIE